MSASRTADENTWDTPDAAHAAAILSTAADAIIGVDRDGLVITVNPATTSVFGVQPGDVLGQPLTLMVPSLDGPAIREAIRNGIWLHVSQCHVARQQITGMRLGEVPFPIEVSIGEVPGDGRVKYSCIVRDITEAKLAEESFNLFSRALECSHNAVMISDASRSPQPIVFVNPAFVRMSGYGPVDVLGRTAAFLLGDETEQPGLPALAEAMATGQEATVTLRHYKRDGTLFYADLSVSPVRDQTGRITHSITILSDVTERVEAERAIAERSARLDAIFDLSPDGFALFDKDGKLVFVNPALQAMTGRRWSGGTGGLTLRSFDTLMHSLCDDTLPYPNLDTSAGARQNKDHLHLVNPEHRVVEREVRRKGEGARETILYFRDITKETEVDRMKSEFLSTAAHELRTPLASIFGFTELMLNRKYPEARQRDMLETMHRQAALLVKLLNELLDLARIEARQGKDFRIANTDLSELVNRTADGLLLKEGQTPAQRQLTPGLRVLADADKLEQALMNLLSNASKYSPHGGTVTVQTSLDQEAHRDFAVIEVRDQGIGMTPAQLAQAFDRFYRADPSGNIPGTGLGLSLVKEIAELHGGYIELESEYGKGTCARMWIPAAPTQASVPNQDLALANAA